MNVRVIRTVTLLLALVELVTGAWSYLAPYSFYRHTPTVSLDPPFNEHLVTDFGGLLLALAFVLGLAAWKMDRLLLRSALSALLLFNVLHLLFHSTHLMGFNTRHAVELLTGLSFSVLTPLLLLLHIQRSTHATHADSSTRWYAIRLPNEAGDAWNQAAVVPKRKSSTGIRKNST